jgi:phosphoesterase RecJ-like protein
MASSPDLVAAATALAPWLLAHPRLLVVTHTRPDGDALGSAFGFAQALNDRGLAARVFVDAPLPAAYVEFAPADLLVAVPVAWTDFDAVVCLDCANLKRLALPNGATLAQVPLPSCNVDHHVDNARYGDLVLIEPATAATAQLLTHLLQAWGWPLSAAAATRLLIGILTDTGGFRHQNTTPAALRTAADLLAAGADHPRVVRAVYGRETPGMLQLKAHIYRTLQLGCGGRYAWFCLTPQVLAECGVDERDTEDLIDTVRALHGVEIACRLQQVPEGVRVSLRSQNAAFPVIEIAHQLGGGGHPLAAGALQKGADLATTEARVLALVKELLGG